MKNFIIKAHTADIRLHLEASSLEELFAVALIGMAAIIKPNSCTNSNLIIKKEIWLQSIDTTALLIDFMSDVLTQSHINKAIFCNVTLSQLSKTSIHATILGEPVENFDEDIKAVTYHEADVKKNMLGNYETVIVFDI